MGQSYLSNNPHIICSWFLPGLYISRPPGHNMSRPPNLCINTLFDPDISRLFISLDISRPPGLDISKPPGLDISRHLVTISVELSI